MYVAVHWYLAMTHDNCRFMIILASSRVTQISRVRKKNYGVVAVPIRVILPNNAEKAKGFKTSMQVLIMKFFNSSISLFI